MNHSDGWRTWIDQTGFPVAATGAAPGNNVVHGLVPGGDATLTIHFQRSSLNVAGMRATLFDASRLDPQLGSELR